MDVRNSLPPSALPWWSRLQQSLMPDYPPVAMRYWWAMAGLGYPLLAACLTNLAGASPWVWLQVLLAMALAMLAGLFPMRVPGTRNSFVAGELIIFLILLLHGAAAAAVVAAGEAGMGSWRTTRRWSSRLLSPALAALAMFSVGSLFDAARALLEAQGLGGTVPLLALGTACGLLYFPVNAMLLSGVIRLKRGERFFQPLDVIGAFRWVGLAYAGSAAMAVLLFESYRHAGAGVLLVMAPLLALLLVTLNFYFRHQEATEALQARANEAAGREAAAAAREAEAAARHLRELQASERRFHGAFTHAAIGMALLARDGRLLQGNASLSSLLGRDIADLVGHGLPEFVHADHAALLAERLAQSADGRFDPSPLELRFVRPDGGAPWATLHFAAFSETEAGEPCCIMQAQDITGQRQAEEQLQHLAFHDTLTGLPNRRRFMQCLEGAVERARADSRYAYAVMFLDFDRFKLVNDSLGHGAGDALLVQLARRLQERLRPTDIVARLGGDEFALLTEHIGHERDAVALAGRLMDTLRAPYVVAGQELQVSASIGITFGSLGYRSAEAVLRDADTAMYKAKADGRSRVAIFDESLHADVSRRLRLESDLRHALDAGSLAVAYQPVFDLERGRLRALEALVRWPHPKEGLLAPAAFLPIAEESGLMQRVSDFMLRTACTQLREWQQAHPPWADLSVSVNVSAEDLAKPGFTARVRSALLVSGLRAEHLTLELTENTLMARIEGAAATLSELRQLGVRVAVDDFGTGYSSLAYLAQLPIDVLKIDRTFVARLASDLDQAAVVRAIVHLGQTLRKSIVAEGIEHPRQVEQLVALGCHLGQGHHLSEPLDSAAIGRLLTGEHAAAPQGAIHLH